MIFIFIVIRGIIIFENLERRCNFTKEAQFKMNFFIFIIFTLAKPLLAVAGTLFKVYSVLGELLA